jgi:uncharacterized protein YggE
MKAVKSLLIAVSLLVASGVQAQSINGQPFIAVHGKARAAVVPDIFPLQIRLKDTSEDAATTQAQIEGHARRVLDLARAAKLDDRDINVANLSVAPQYRYNDDTDQQVFLGNTYERTIKLRFRSLPGLQAMIDALPKSEQVQLDTGGFQSSKADELRRQLLAGAVADARKTAEVMAAAVGKRVGTVHNVSNQGFNVRYVTSGDSTELDSITVTGARIPPPPPPVALREGVIQLDQSVYIIYTLVE